MTDNQLKLEVLKLSIEMARETMYARRLELENGWSNRVTETPFPKLPSIDHTEVVSIYKTLIKEIR